MIENHMQIVRNISDMASHRQVSNHKITTWITYVVTLVFISDRNHLCLCRCYVKTVSFSSHIIY